MSSIGERLKRLEEIARGGDVPDWAAERIAAKRAAMGNEDEFFARLEREIEDAEREVAQIRQRIH